IDGFNLALPNGSGVATYARTLAWSLRAMGHGVDLVYGVAVGHRAPASLREVLFFDGLDREPPARRGMARRLAAVGEGVRDVFGRRAVPVPRAGHVLATGLEDRVPACERLFTSADVFEAAARHFRRHGRFLRLRLPDPPEIMHWTYPLPVRVEGARNVYTIHDLVPLRLPYTSLENKRYHHRLVRACLRTGDHICTVSDTSRADLLAMFPETDPARVTNTWQAVIPPDDDADAASVASRLAATFELEPGGYFLYFGAIEPKKNIGRLVEAYLASQVRTPLVIVGARAWKSGAEVRLLQGEGGHTLRGVAERIRRYDYLPRAWLMTLVRGARALTFPSLYEGFGLPVLEAMALGTPVLTSSAASLPEVAGDAALLVDPYRVDDIARALRRLDGDAALRATLSAAGLRQAQRFAPARYQARLARMYARVHRA
uniref:glycosyltransferase family 4 protein n=1 Tax=Cupriavidus sp. WS TaxID=1312922 RepID=UPI000366D691